MKQEFIICIFLHLKVLDYQIMNVGEYINIILFYRLTAVSDNVNLYYSIIIYSKLYNFNLSDVEKGNKVSYKCNLSTALYIYIITKIKINENIG